MAGRLLYLSRQPIFFYQHHPSLSSHCVQHFLGDYKFIESVSCFATFSSNCCRRRDINKDLLISSACLLFNVRFVAVDLSLSLTTFALFVCNALIPSACIFFSVRWISSNLPLCNSIGWSSVNVSWIFFNLQLPAIPLADIFPLFSFQRQLDFLQFIAALQFHWLASFSRLLVYVLFVTLQFHWLISLHDYKRRIISCHSGAVSRK